MKCITGLVSVIMGIYNCENTLSKAIDSILAQTYENWELIMCDDGSSDGTFELAEKFRQKYPEKIILIRNEQNQGLNITLNNCLKQARGEFVARQDADDWSLPDRFEKEISYLKSHPDFSFVGTAMIVNDGQSNIAVRKVSGLYPDKYGFMKSNQFHHATVIIKTDVIKSVDGYSVDKRLLRVEDYNLWTKLYAKGFKGCNMEEALYVVLEDEATYSRRTFSNRINEAYSKKLAIEMLELPKYNYVYVIYSLAKGFVPQFLYRYIHKKKTIKNNNLIQQVNID